MDEHLIRLSKTIAHALRHKPEEYGLVLDVEGWVALDDLLAALHKRSRVWHSVNRATLEAIIADSEKQRFELRGNRIRAFYGHSTSGKITREAAIPPTTLYHGTTREAAQAILREGLKPMKRQYVHLSTDQQTARIVGQRRTNHPVILRIAAREAYQQGIPFYLGNEDIWLAEVIPPVFISLG